MDLSNLRPADGSKQSDNFRRGRGHGSGNGKTAGKGHKGQKARSGATRPGFEGGQMPLQRRLPKRGFKSMHATFKAEVRLSDLNNLAVGDVDILVLKQAGVLGVLARDVRVILSGEITKAVNLKGLKVSAGAKAAIEAAGGSVA